MEKSELFKDSPPFFAYWLIFVSTFSTYSIELPGGIGLTPVNLFSILFFPVMLAHMLVQNRLPPISSVGVLHLLYVLVSLAGVLFAPYPFGALKSAGSYLLEYLTCFFIILFFLNTREEVEKAAKVFLITCFINAVMGWVQLLGFFFFKKIIFPPLASIFRGAMSAKNFGYGTGAFSIPGFMRMFGFSGDAFGSIMVIPFGLSLYFASKLGPKRKLYLMLAVFFALTIILAASRSGIVGIIVCAIFAYILKKPDRFRPFPMLFNTAKLCFVLLSVLSIFYLAANPTLIEKETIHFDKNNAIKSPIFLINRMNPFIEKSYAKSSVYFTEHGKLAMKYGLANLGFGIGGENFDDFITKRYRIRYGSHSNFVLFLGDTGIWGLLIQILVVFFTLYYGLSTYFSSRTKIVINSLDSRYDHLLLYLSALFLGLVMTGIVRTFYLVPESFLVSALIIKLKQLQTTKSLTSHDRSVQSVPGDFKAADL